MLSTTTISTSASAASIPIVAGDACNISRMAGWSSRRRACASGAGPIRADLRPWS
jgi:hypothetical protein